jgi:Na+/proline symporter
MSLIVLMFIMQTIHNAAVYYEAWLGFIQYGGTSNQALAVFIDDEAAVPLIIPTYSMSQFLGVLRLAIADSIMVSTSVL